MAKAIAFMRVSLPDGYLFKNSNTHLISDWDQKALSSLSFGIIMTIEAYSGF